MIRFLRSRPFVCLFILILLVALNAAAYYYVFYPPKQFLTVAFLDVGQGDAILIESPNGTQMLVDGGRDRSVLRQLPSVMGPLDRTLDLIVETHPDADHINGLSEVLARYQVNAYLTPDIEKASSQAERLAVFAAKEPGLVKVIARQGQRIHLGAGAYADVLYPDHPLQSDDTNAGSVVLHVVYGSTAFMLTGDLPSAGEKYVLAHHEPSMLKSDVLKAGHHGSRTSTADAWLIAVDPDTVVVSAGKENSYGHPHEEVVERVRVYGAELLSTVDLHTIVFRSDGTRVTRE